MPLLLMRSFPGTLLDQSCRASVRRQIEYGRQRGVPWGISESAYAFTDRAGNYQYRAFGVPGLGLKRGLADDLVVAPYATALASLVDPGGGGDEFRRDWRARGSTADSGSTRRSTTTRAAATSRRRRAATAAARRSCAPSSRTTRACRSSRSPTSSATTSFVDALPRRSAGPGDRAAAAGARAARGDPVGAAARRERDSAAPSLPVFASTAVPLAAHDQPAHAFPVERPLHDRAHARRRRLQHVARPGGHAAARGPHLRRRRALHLPARSVVGPRLVAHLSAGLPGARPVRGHLRARQGHVPPPRRRLRDAARRSPCRPRTTSKCGGCRSPTAATRPREIEVTSYAEIVLARPEDDLAHPAFGKLFIETEFDAQSAGLLFSRRPRAADEAPIVGVPRARRRRAALGGAVEWETDRARFLGRGRSPANPMALDGRALSGTTGAVLDPIAALRERVRLAPGAFVRVTFATGVAPDRDAALALARKYRDGSAAARAFSMAFTHVHITLQHLGPERRARDALRSPGVARVRRRRVVHQPGRSRAATSSASRTCGATASPAICRSCSCASPTPTSLPLVRQLLNAQEYWRVKGLRADVVILNEHPADYLDEMQNLLTSSCRNRRWAGWLGQARRHVPAARRRACPTPIAVCSSAVARVVCRGDLGDLVVATGSSGAVAVRRARRAAVGRRCRAPAARADAGRRCRRWSWRTGSAASRPTAASTSSCSTANARRRCPGRTCWRTRRSARSSAASGSRVHLGRQQPREPADAVRQRSAHRSDRRGHLPARRRVRRGVGRHAGAAAAAAGWRALGRPSRGRASRATSTPSRASSRSSTVFVAPDDPVKLARADADQHVDRRAAPQRVRLRRVVPGAAARRRAPVRRHRARRAERRDARAQRLQHGVRRARRVLARHRARRARTPAIAPSSSGATAR